MGRLAGRGLVVLSALAAASAGRAETSVFEIGQKNGVKACATTLKEVSEFVLKDKQHGSHATWNANDADRRLFTSMTSKYYADGDSHVTVVVSPTTSGKCDATYVETFALPQSCLMAREKTYKEWKLVGDLDAKTLVLANDGGAVNVYLTPQGDQICLVSRRETVYGE